jgi:hypothetical protein
MRTSNLVKELTVRNNANKIKIPQANDIIRFTFFSLNLHWIFTKTTFVCFFGATEK